MPAAKSSEPITVRTSKETIARIDALAASMDRSRNYLVGQALEEYLERNAWQIERIEAGLADLRAGRVIPAEDVFSEIGEKHGWKL
ncbi:CopG family ribbon-helix-helix protein [Novosphingobium sp. NDB2Meth1]|uniref:CopG family ribbon-helix-helix protein n=1 Tax=Novosphingobium sp. NDB2Meth1 TaxID=1892847 RepID=UPI0009304474|nr:ribbon-helix-helix protein, CopG family [Novosphingobium sp. NDB2Meth1]